METNEELKTQYKEVSVYLMHPRNNFKCFVVKCGRGSTHEKIRSNMIKFTPIDDQLTPNSPIIGYSTTCKRYIAYISIFSIASQKVRFYFHLLIYFLNKWIRCNFYDFCKRIDPLFEFHHDLSNLGQFQRKNDVVIEFVKSNSGENRRFSRLNLPGCPRKGRKLYIVLPDGIWPPKHDDFVWFFTKVNEKSFECSTPKCNYSTPRADHLAKHVKTCTVGFTLFYLILSLVKNVVKMTCSTKVYGDSNEIDLEEELFKRGYIKAASWDKRAFAVYDIETLERQIDATDSNIEANLSLVSIAACDTMSETPEYYNVIDDVEEEEEAGETKDKNKQKMGQ